MFYSEPSLMRLCSNCPGHILIGALLLFFFNCPLAANTEQARLLVHTLGYISRDYSNAVQAGVVKNTDEFVELNQFAQSAVQYARALEQTQKLSALDSLAAGAIELQKKIGGKSDAQEVIALANSLREKTIRLSGLVMSPSSYPNLMAGKATFAAHCARCHGEKGYGDGAEGIKLNPPPRNFHDNERMKLLSPFSVFNTVRCGIAGTGMKPHPELSDEEVWNVAFYVMSLRYTKPANSTISTIPLEKIATLSDADLQQQLQLPAESLAAARFQQPATEKINYVNIAAMYLDEAFTAARNHHFAQAQQLAGMAYLEGIEPLEKQLRATDPALMEHLEAQQLNLRKMLTDGASLTAVADSFKLSKKLLEQVETSMSKKPVSFALALFLTISILLREGLEAFLVIMVILSVLNASGFKAQRIYVQAGWVLAIVGGLLLWYTVGRVLHAHRANIELLEGIIALLAVGMLLYVGFWLHSKSEVSKWKKYVQEKIKGVMTRESLWGLFALSFFVVFREVFESVLFLTVLNVESNGSNARAIWLGVLVALAILLVLAFVVLRFSSRLPVPTLFKISSWMMAALAVVLAGKGFHSFQEIGYVPVHSLAFIPKIDWLGLFPTVETIAAQIFIFAVSCWFLWSRDTSPKPFQTKQE